MDLVDTLVSAVIQGSAAFQVTQVLAVSAEFQVSQVTLGLVGSLATQEYLVSQVSVDSVGFLGSVATLA